MADVAGLASVYISSDTDIDPFCEPCFKDGNLKEAAGFCPKCIEYYCPTCLGTHRRSSMTERHKIDTGDDMPKSMADTPDCEIPAMC